MGSSGASRFSDYPEKPKTKVSSAGGRGGSAGGSSGEDPCDSAFSTIIEDFELSPYFIKYGAPPKIGTKVVIEKSKRIVVRVVGAELLGNLPTQFNYLASCMAAGRTYGGHIQAVNIGLLTRITIDVAPQ